MWSARRMPAELDALCLAHIARFKRPKDYVFVDALPKNNYGKILKTELRAMDAEKGRSAMNEIDRKTAAALPALRQAGGSRRSSRSAPSAAPISISIAGCPGVYAVPVKEDEDEDGERPTDDDAERENERRRRLARPSVRDAQARRYPPGRLCARCRPFAADRALPRRSATSATSCSPPKRRAWRWPPAPGSAASAPRC